MASSKQHFAIGAALGAGLNLAYQLVQLQRDPSRPFDLFQLAAYAALGGGIAVLADAIEPATNPNHRGFFHSFTFASVSSYACYGRHTENWSSDQKTAARFVHACYVSHLVADAITPRGLPILCSDF